MEILDASGPVEFSPERHVYRALARTALCSVGVVGWEAGQASSIHRHPGADEIYQVLAGEGLFETEGRRVRLGPGSVVLFPAGEVHRVRALTRMVLYRIQAGADRHPERLEAWPERPAPPCP